MTSFPELSSGVIPPGELNNAPLGSVGLNLPFGIGVGAEYSNYTIAGTVKSDNIPAAGYTVRVYRRDNGALLGETISDGSGMFHLDTVGHPGTVTVVALDNLETRNALVFDRVLPS